MMKTYTLRSLSIPTIEKPNWLSELNPQQLDCVLHESGPAVIVAGAGTGKTKTLTYRIAWLLEKRVRPDQILMLTFTRQAADTMISRAKLLRPEASFIIGGTFHSFSNVILREFGHLIGYPNNFTILDSSDAEDRIDVVRTEFLNLTEKKVRFPKKSTLQTLFSSHRNTGRLLEEIIESEYPQYVEQTELIEQIFIAYQKQKKKYHLADYDDLLHLVLELFDQHEQVVLSLSRRYLHILVDEYQDTNGIQAQIVERIAGKNGNLMVVGDDAQSIYRFRGADFRNFLNFPKRYPQSAIYKLEKNYRSTQQILQVANAIISQTHVKFDKELFSDKKNGELPVIVQAPDDHFQNHFIISKLLDLREEGISFGDMAVLFRNSRNSYSLELELTAQNIPFEKRGGIKFSESSHIKDLLSYLKIALNPRDIVSWNRVLQLIDGIGPKSADEIIKRMEDGGSTDIQPFISPKYKSHINELFQLVEFLSGNESVSEKISKLLLFYQPIFQKKYFEDYPKREKDLAAFESICLRYSDMTECITRLTLEPIQASHTETNHVNPDEAPLILSTIHSAKGLEWHSVFLMDMVDGILPNTYALDNEEELDEELRLFYVAVTRAKEHLFMAYPVMNYHRQFKDYLTQPSRFLQQLPNDLHEKWNLTTEMTKQITNGQS